MDRVSKEVETLWNELEPARELLVQKGTDISFMFDSFNSIKVLIGLPTITSEEIVMELNEYYNDDVTYDDEEGEFHIDNDTICYVFKFKGVNKLLIKWCKSVPLTITHKITTFFMEANDNE